MPIQEYDYDEYISGSGEIRHVTVTIKQGLTLPKFTPIMHEAASGHFIAVPAAGPKAQYLTAFDVDTTGGAKEHSVLSCITIDPDFVNYPTGMTAQVKSGLFAGTPIGVQKKQPF